MDELQKLLENAGVETEAVISPKGTDFGDTDKMITRGKPDVFADRDVMWDEADLPTLTREVGRVNELANQLIGAISDKDGEAFDSTMRKLEKAVSDLEARRSGRRKDLGDPMEQ